MTDHSPQATRPATSCAEGLTTCPDLHTASRRRAIRHRRSPTGGNSCSARPAGRSWHGPSPRSPGVAERPANSAPNWDQLGRTLKGNFQSFNCSWAMKQAMDRLIAWQDKLYSAMGAYASDRSYQNFTDPELESPLPAYYGENLPRLIEVKHQFDPDNVFTFPQSIRG